MTDRQRLAELETAYAELVRKQNRLDRAADVDEVTGYALHRLLKK